MERLSVCIYISIVLGLLSYLVLQVVILFLEIRQLFYPNFHATLLSVWTSFVDSNQSIDPYEVIKACLTSIPIALFLTYLNEKKIFNRFAQWSKISTKYGDENLFFFLLNSRNVYWVNVHRISQDLTYQGLVDSFAAGKTTYELLLNDVKVYRHSDSAFLYELAHIYYLEQLFFQQINLP